MPDLPHQGWEERKEQNMWLAPLTEWGVGGKGGLFPTFSVLLWPAACPFSAVATLALIGDEDDIPPCAWESTAVIAQLFPLVISCGALPLTTIDLAHVTPFHKLLFRLASAHQPVELLSSSAAHMQFLRSKVRSRDSFWPCLPF